MTGQGARCVCPVMDVSNFAAWRGGDRFARGHNPRCPVHAVPVPDTVREALIVARDWIADLPEVKSLAAREQRLRHAVERVLKRHANTCSDREYCADEGDLFQALCVCEWAESAARGWGQLDAKRMDPNCPVHGPEVARA